MKRRHEASSPLPSKRRMTGNRNSYNSNERGKQTIEKGKEQLASKTKPNENVIKMECCCCFDDQCNFEDICSCPSGHMFCKTCVLRSTEAAFNAMKVSFPCLESGCDTNISLVTIQKVVPSDLFTKIIRRLQEVEVQQANIANIVHCPSCPYACVMDNLEDKLLICQNPKCRKESCRICKKPNHIPLRCSEVESQSHTAMRTFLENYIAEAVVRKCHRCKKRFVKSKGCNMMTCPCGATSCYVCRGKNIKYSHFMRSTPCRDTDPDVIHARDIQTAAMSAKAEYLKTHPDANRREMDKVMNDILGTKYKFSLSGVLPTLLSILFGIVLGLCFILYGWKQPFFLLMIYHIYNQLFQNE